MGLGNQAALEQLQNAEKQHSIKVDSLNDQLLDKEQEIADAQQKLSEKETKIEVQAQQLQQMQQVVADSDIKSKNTNKLQTELSEQTSRLIEAQEQIKALQALLEQKNAEIRGLSHQKSELVATAAENAENLKKFDEETKTTTKKLETFEKENKELKNELELLQQLQKQQKFQIDEANLEVQKLKIENKLLSELSSRKLQENKQKTLGQEVENCLKPDQKKDETYENDVKQNIQIENNKYQLERESAKEQKIEAPLLSNQNETNENGGKIVELTFDQIQGFQLTQNAEHQLKLTVSQTNSDVKQETNRIINEIYHICATQNFQIPNQVSYSGADNQITFKFRLGAKIILDDCLNLDLDRKNYYDTQSPNSRVSQLLIRAANALCQEIPVSPKENLTVEQLHLINEMIKIKYPELWFLEMTAQSNEQGVVHKIQLFKEDKRIITNLNNQLFEIKKQFESQNKDLIYSCSLNQFDILLKYKLEEVIVKQLQQTEYVLNNIQSHLYDVVGCLINKQCACQGFAAGFSFLAHISGLEIIQVVGKSLKIEDNYEGSNPTHRWNMIKLDEWYHIDPTWLKPNAASRIYLNFSDKLRFSEVELFQQLSPPAANNMKWNYFSHENKLLLDKQQVSEYVTNVGLTSLVGEFYSTFPVDLALEIQNLRYSQEKDFKYQFSFAQAATLYFYHFELTCDAALLKGYPEIATIGQKYFVKDDGEFETRIQDLMSVSGATSVSHSKNGDMIEFTCKKAE